MGGVLASLELGLGTNEVRSAETMAPALVRIGLMGGATMIAANVLGAWSCIEGASGVADATWLPLGETYHSPHDPECLRNYCVQTNVIWACVSAITGLLLSGAGLMRSKTLLVFFFAALAARVCFIVMEFVLATAIRAPCPLISLVAAPWTSFVTVVQLGSFAAVASRYYAILKKAATAHAAALRVRDKGGLAVAAERGGAAERQGCRLQEAGRQAMLELTREEGRGEERLEEGRREREETGGGEKEQATAEARV
mmetsp:Transcript_3259/g.6645  ORF Transcript_3259/g.6645 Transcript_3259/m.6645 type:complete len:255 (+) Transcript_3259:217-981(+)